MSRSFFVLALALAAAACVAALDFPDTYEYYVTFDNAHTGGSGTGYMFASDSWSVRSPLPSRRRIDEAHPPTSTCTLRATTPRVTG